MIEHCVTLSGQACKYEDLLKGLASQVAQRHPGACNVGYRVLSLDWEDPLEKEMATHSSILAWRIPWIEELGGLQSTGLQRVGHDRATSLSFLKV